MTVINCFVFIYCCAFVGGSYLIVYFLFSFRSGLLLHNWKKLHLVPLLWWDHQLWVVCITVIQRPPVQRLCKEANKSHILLLKLLIQQLGAHGQGSTNPALEQASLKNVSEHQLALLKELDTSSSNFFELNLTFVFQLAKGHVRLLVILRAFHYSYLIKHYIACASHSVWIPV